MNNVLVFMLILVTAGVFSTLIVLYRSKWFKDNKRKLTAVVLTAILIGSGAVIIMDEPPALATSATLPGTAANVDSGGDDWDVPNNAKDNNNVYAAATTEDGVLTDYLYVSNFGFSSVIAASDIVTGIQVAVHRKASAATTITDDLIELVDGAATPQLPNKATADTWPSSEATATYTWTWANLNTSTIDVTDVRDSDFGVYVSAITSGATTRTASIDCIYITVTYKSSNTAPTVGTPSPASNAINILRYPAINITVADVDVAQTLTVCFWNNVSGSWLQTNHGQNLTESATSHVVRDMNASFVSEYYKKYWWKVTVYDGSANVTSGIYNFTTINFTFQNNPPTQTDEDPGNGSTGVDLSPMISINVSDMLVHANWEQYCGDNLHTGVQENTTQPGIHKKRLWNITTNGTYDEFDGVMVHDGIGYVGLKGNNSFTAFYINNGTKVWNYTIPGGSDDAALYHDGKIYVVQCGDDVAGLRDYLYCFNETTNDTADLYWTVKLNGSANGKAGSPVYSPEDNCIFVNIESKTWAVYLNGTTKWNSSVLSTATASSPLYYNGLVYTFYPDVDEGIVCRYSNNGTLKWQFKNNSRYWDSSGVIVPENHALYVTPNGLADADLYCLNLTTGAVIFNVSGLTGTSITYQTPAYHDGKLFFNRGTISYCLNASTSSMSVATRTIWQKAVCGDVCFSSPIVSNGYVYFGCSDGYIYCLNELTGYLKWKYSTGANAVFGQTCIADGILMFNTDNRQIIALGDLQQYNQTLDNAMNVTFATNESGSWVNKQTNSSVYAGTYRWNFTDADVGSHKYWWKVYVNDSIDNISKIYHFTTETIPTDTIRNNGVDYMVWLGSNTTAYWVNQSITGMNEATESISIWNRTGWSTTTGLWQTYNGTRTGVNWTVHTFDIIRTYLDDAAGNQTITMTENPDMDYDGSHAIPLHYNTLNKGYNFSAYNRVAPTTLSAINQSIGLFDGDMVARWNRTIFAWDIFICYFGPDDYAVSRWDVIQIKSRTDLTWTT